jgi:hypothetical protein
MAISLTRPWQGIKTSDNVYRNVYEKLWIANLGALNAISFHKFQFLSFG